jgi:hypothetical protein
VRAIEQADDGVGTVGRPVRGALDDGSEDAADPVADDLRLRVQSTEFVPRVEDRRSEGGQGIAVQVDQSELAAHGGMEPLGHRAFRQLQDTGFQVGRKAGIEGKDQFLVAAEEDARPLRCAACGTGTPLEEPVPQPFARQQADGCLQQPLPRLPVNTLISGRLRHAPTPTRLQQTNPRASL